MSFDWLSSKRPLDVIARAIETSLVANGTAKPKKKNATEWGKDPERGAVMLTLFRVLAGAGKTRLNEHYAWVVDPTDNVFAYLASTKQEDANYYTRSWEEDRTANEPSTAAETRRRRTAGDTKTAPCDTKTAPFMEFAQCFDLEFRHKLIRDDKLLRSLLKACAVTLNSEYDKNRRITLHNLTVMPLIRPRFVPCLPLPSQPEDPEWRCTASGATWQAMLGVARAFGGTRPPTVLVTGPPGSGKEAYARAVHFGQRRNWGKSDDDKALVTLSLGEVGAKEMRERIGGGLLWKLNQQRGTLFLDEVDKASSEVRSYLLRILENRRYENAWGEEQSCKEVAFVVAAGKPLAALRGMEPPDFWTRMEVHVSVADPLTAGSQLEREPLLEAFFKFFWWDAVSGWLAGYQGVLSKRQRSKDKEKEEEKWLKHLRDPDFLKEDLFEMAIGKMNEENLEFETSRMVKLVAKQFASVLAPHLERRQLSVRGLRTAVGAVQRATRSQLAAMAILRNGEAEEVFKEAAEQAIYEAVGTVLQVLPDDNEARRQVRT